MNASAVVPIKRFSAAHQRLAERLDEPQRAGLAMASFADSLARIVECEALERVVVVTDEPKAERHALWRARRTKVPIEVLQDPDDSGHSAAAAIGAEWVRRLGAEAVALLPGDCPLVDPAALAEAIAALEPDTVLVVPDHHGEGTNAVLMSPPNAITPSFGPGSRERHLELARKHGLRSEALEIGSLALDLDTPDDLAMMAARLVEDPEAAPRTAEALRRMKVKPAPAGRPT